jgi:hypothetical protein
MLAHARRTRFPALMAVVLCLLLVGLGCEKKPVRAVPAVLAPSIETEPQPVPVPPHPADENANVPPPAPANEPQTNQPKPADNSAQITADVPRAAVQSQRQNTENLLRNSEGKLGHISRTLGESEEGMLRQARNYIAQSNQALQAGDIERAYNLAVKASLLANELTK